MAQMVLSNKGAAIIKQSLLKQNRQIVKLHTVYQIRTYRAEPLGYGYLK